jgi:hypothetical protein
MANAFKLIGKLIKKNKKDEPEATEESAAGEASEADIAIGSTDSSPRWRAGDRATVKLDGIGEVVVPRGDMSDDEWNTFLDEAKKKNKLQGETVVETVQDRELNARTGKSKYESRPKSDYMEVTVGRGRGEVAVVPRGDMDQTSWEALKQRAKKMGVFRGSNDTLKEKVQQGTGQVEKYAGPESDGTGLDADETAPTEPTQPTGDGRDRDLEDLQLQRGDAGGARGIKKFVQQGLPGTIGGRGGDVGTVQSIDEPAPQPAPAQQRSKGVAARGNVEIGEPEIGAPVAKSTAVDDGLTRATQRAEVENALAPVRGAGAKARAMEAGVQAPEDTGPSNLTRDLLQGYAKPASDMMDTIGRGLQGVGHQLLPNTIAAPTQPQSTMVPPPSPAQAGAPPDVTGLPATKPGAPPPPGGAPGSGSMSMSMSRSGGAQPDINMPDRTGEIDKAYSDAARAQMAQADLEANGLKQKAQAFDDGLKEQVRQNAKIVEIQERTRVEREKPMAIYNQMLSELMQPTKQIDPHRWWNSRSTGQKIMLALGALLTKGGSVRMVQSAIDNDLATQQQEIQTEMGRKKAVLGAADNMIGMIRQQGADDVQAVQIYKAMSWDMVAKRLEMVAANTDSQTIKMKAEQNIAEANVKRNQVLTEMDKYSADLAIRKAHLANESEAIAIKRQKALGGGGKPKKLERLKGPQVTKIAALQTALAKTEELENRFRSNNGNAMEAMLNKGAEYVPGSKSNRFNYDAEMNIANIADTLGNAGVLQPGEVERYKKIHPQAGDLDGAYRMQSLRSDIQRRLDKEIAAFKAAGFDVEELQGDAGPSTFQPDEEE